MPEMKKTTAETVSRIVNEVNKPLYWKTDAKITPLIMGPTVCPTSIIVLKKPIDVPTGMFEVNSHINGAVEETAIAKPKPKPMEIRRRNTKDVVNGIRNSKMALIRQPSIIGMRRLVLSEKRPIIGLETIKDIS